MQTEQELRKEIEEKIDRLQEAHLSFIEHLQNNTELISDYMLINKIKQSQLNLINDLQVEIEKKSITTSKLKKLRRDIKIQLIIMQKK